MRIPLAAMAATGLVTLMAPAHAQTGWNSGAMPPAFAGRSTVLRAGPEGGYPEVRQVMQGERLDLHGCLDDRSWCDVSYGPDRGWIYGDDLMAEYQGRQLGIAMLANILGIVTLPFAIGPYWDNYYRSQPFYDDRYRWEQAYFDRYQPNWGPRPDQPFWGSRTLVGTMLRRSWLYAGPDPSYPRVARVNSGAQVTVNGCLSDRSWCDITWRYDRGWVPGRDVATTWRGRRQSLDSVAAAIGLGILMFRFNDYWDNNYRNRPFYRERDRWQQQYNRTWQPSWGPSPNQPQPGYQPPRYQPPRTQPPQNQPWQQQRPNMPPPQPPVPQYGQPPRPPQPPMAQPPVPPQPRAAEPWRANPPAHQHQMPPQMPQMPPQMPTQPPQASLPPANLPPMNPPVTQPMPPTPPAQPRFQMPDRPTAPAVQPQMPPMPPRTPTPPSPPPQPRFQPPERPTAPATQPAMPQMPTPPTAAYPTHGPQPQPPTPQSMPDPTRGPQPRPNEPDRRPQRPPKG